MVYPVKATFSYSYTGFQQSQGDNDFPGTQIDNDLASLKTVTDALVDFIKVTLGADGRLKAASITPAMLTFELYEMIDGSVIAGVDAIAQNIDINPIDGLSAAHVQGALETLQTDKAASAHSHAAGSISLSAIAGLVAANVQSAFVEVVALLPRTGDVVLTLDNVAPSGWVMFDDGTIGSATSGATTRANADCEALYKLIWNNISNSRAPVTGGRGASADDDWAADKPIALTKMLGRALAIAGSGSGLTARNLGQTVGVENQSLTVANLPPHNHAASIAPSGTHEHFLEDVSTGDTTLGSGDPVLRELTPDDRIKTVTGGAHTHPVTVNDTGSGTAHNNMQPTTFLNARVKL